MSTFVKTGDRIEVFQRPYSNEESEGEGTVTEVHKISDMESARVSVQFDGDPIGETYVRWVLPSHLCP